MYFVRWFDPARARPLIRDFHRKREATDFRDRLPWLSELGCYPPAKRKGWADLRRASLTTPST